MREDFYWLDGPWKGRLAIAPRPRGGDWLQDEIQSWSSAGVALVVSALEEHEMQELDLAREPALCKASGIEDLSFPIVDRGVPSSMHRTAELVQQLDRELSAGKNLAIHCRQGLGRSPLLAACLLVTTGLDGETAFRRIQTIRGGVVPETVEQRQWVSQFARRLAAAPAGNEAG
jgi:protein-tyrosine phosphatase